MIIFSNQKLYCLCVKFSVYVLLGCLSIFSIGFTTISSTQNVNTPQVMVANNTDIPPSEQSNTPTIITQTSSNFQDQIVNGSQSFDIKNVNAVQVTNGAINSSMQTNTSNPVMGNQPGVMIQNTPVQNGNNSVMNGVSSPQNTQTVNNGNALSGTNNSMPVALNTAAMPNGMQITSNQSGNMPTVMTQAGNIAMPGKKPVNSIIETGQTGAGIMNTQPQPSIYTVEATDGPSYLKAIKNATKRFGHDESLAAFAAAALVPVKPDADYAVVCIQKTRNGLFRIHSQNPAALGILTGKVDQVAFKALFKLNKWATFDYNVPANADGTGNITTYYGQIFLKHGDGTVHGDTICFARYR